MEKNKLIMGTEGENLKRIVRKDKVTFIDGTDRFHLISYNEKTEEYIFTSDVDIKVKIGTRPRGSDGMGELIVLDELSVWTTSGWFEIDITKDLDEYYSDFWIDHLSDIRVDVNGDFYSRNELSEDELDDIEMKKLEKMLEESQKLVKKKGHSPFNGLNL